MTATQKATLRAARLALHVAARDYLAAIEAIETALTDEDREVLTVDAMDLELRCESLLEDSGPLFAVDES